MADEGWDDDEFGLFESADASTITNAPVITSAQPVTPAWLLAAQHHVSESIKVEPAHVELHEEHSTNKQVFPNVKEIDPQPESSDLPKNDKQIFVPDSVGDCESLYTNTDKDASLTISSDFFKASSDCVINKDADVQVVMKENKEIIDLKGKLDNAITLKFHTEESLKKLQEELSKSLEDAERQREEKEVQHSCEIERMTRKHEDEVASMREEAQKMMQILTEKYSALAARSSVELMEKNEHNVEHIVAKCLELLEAQSSVISEKLSVDASSSNINTSNLFNSCKEELKEFVQTQCDGTVAKCKNLKQEVSDYLKTEINEEMERQRVVDLQNKEKFMEEMAQNFKLQLEETMKIEREKSRNAIKVAVSEMKESVKKSMEADFEKNKVIHDQHLTALQMLLTSSQEHLRHLTTSLKSNTS